MVYFVMFRGHSIHMNLKIWRWKLGPYGLAACGIILLNACMRFALISQGWPPANSDEGTLGLMAMHIAYRGQLPIFFYGQGYMGSLEAYVGAALFPLFGSGFLALRAGVLLLFTLFLALMYLLVSLLYDKKLALIALVLLSLGTPEILSREMQAQADHPETPLFCTAIVLFTTGLALTASPSPPDISSQGQAKRLILYSLWGLLVGAALWNDPLAWSYILLAGIVLFLFCHHELWLPAYIAVLLGFLVGITPIIIYNLTAPISQSTFSVFGFLIGYHAPVAASSSILDKLAGAILVSLPVATGANTVCNLQSSQAWPLDKLTPAAFRCTLLHGGWGLALIALWLFALFIAIRALRQPWYRPLTAELSFAERREAVIQFARVVMLGGAGLSFIVFALSAQSVTDPWNNSRYLVVLAVAVPAMFWPLWSAASVGRGRGSWSIIVKRVFLCGVLLVFSATLVVGTIDTFAQLPSTQTTNRQQQALVADLLRLHATRIYTDYWTCDLVSFLSREAIICSVLDEQLQPGVNRYPPYTVIVDSDPNASYVFPVGSPESTAFMKKVAREGLHYRLVVAIHYDIYQPLSGTQKN